MKSKVFWIMLIVFALPANNRIWGQEVTIITEPGEYVVPNDNNIPRNSVTKIVVEKVDPSQVQIGFGWTTNFWSTPVMHPEDNYETPFVHCYLPGHYGNIGSGGTGSTRVSYISDPWIGIDGLATTDSPHLTSFNGTIVAENYVEIKVSDLFVDNWTSVSGNAYTCSYFYRVFDDESYGEGSYNQPSYKITNSGRYLFYTVSGMARLEETYFDVVLTNTVSEVVVSPQSIYTDGNETLQFSSTVVGTQPGLANQDVIWAVSGIDTEHSSPSSWTQITQDGLLTIGVTEPSGAILTVTATSVYDPSKSGTATVIVGMSPDTPTYTVTLATVPLGGSVSFFTNEPYYFGSPCSVNCWDNDGWQVLCWTVNGDTVRNDDGSIFTESFYYFYVTENTDIVVHFTHPSDIGTLPIPPLRAYTSVLDGQLIIDNAPSEAKVQILDVAGREIINAKLSDGKSINISRLPQGIYVVKILSENGTSISQKIVKR